MSIRGPFPTSRSGSRSGPARVTGGSPTKSYDPTAWAEKKRLAVVVVYWGALRALYLDGYKSSLADSSGGGGSSDNIARAEKLKVERRKAKEAAASREKVVGEEETLMEVHDNVNYNPLSYVDNGNARKEEDVGGTLRGESEFLRTKAVEEYLKQGEGKEESPEEGEKTGPMQWEWIGPPQAETRPAEGGEHGGVGEEGKSAATPAELRDSDAVGGGVLDGSAAEQQQPPDALPTSLAEKLSRRREPPTARQPKSGSVRPRLLEGRGPPEGHPLQTRSSKPRLLNSSSGRVRGAAVAEAKRSGKSSEVKAAERRVGGKAAPPTRRPPPPKARDGVNSASTQATTASGDARVSRKGSNCSVEGSRRKRTAAAAKALREEDPSTTRDALAGTRALIDDENCIIEFSTDVNSELIFIAIIIVRESGRLKRLRKLSHR
ncbi:hypothetical protein FOZ63_009252 [Perkinsus olseni]|uniref:Uncharacterized protein n=1 Tax=Perkinsus olseni TaxID=32597 RepID=A0A7J6N5L9_PEROL|nr:hypothetical protein FOZ63_009252 [Perkinsus olseni]